MKKTILTILLLDIACCTLAQTEDAVTAQNLQEEVSSEDTLKDLQVQYAQLQMEFQQLQGEFQSLRQSLYQDYADYLELPFSVISVIKTHNIENFAARYTDIDEEAPTLLKRAKACIKHKQNYNRLKDLLTQPYDASNVKAARDSLLILRKLAKDEKWEELAMSKAQWNETDSIDVFLARYQPGIVWLQNVMKKCEQQYKSDGLDPTANADIALSRDLRQMIISDADKRQMENVKRRVSPQGNVADYILTIPWLRQRYNAYVSEQNPLKPSETTLQAIKEIIDINIGL